MLALITMIIAACSASPGTGTDPEPGGGDLPSDERFEVSGIVVAGPTQPPTMDADDADMTRPVEGAELSVRSLDGVELTVVVTDREGRFTTTLPAGTYDIVPQAVEGLMGTADRQTVEVPTVDELRFEYDTGIR